MSALFFLAANATPLFDTAPINCLFAFLSVSLFASTAVSPVRPVFRDYGLIHPLLPVQVRQGTSPILSFSVSFQCGGQGVCSKLEVVISRQKTVPFVWSRQCWVRGRVVCVMCFKASCSSLSLWCRWPMQRDRCGGMRRFVMMQMMDGRVVS